MSKENPTLSDCDDGVIEKTWTGLLITWINNCVAPEQTISTLRPEILCRIINKYKGDVYGDIHDNLDVEEIEALIGHRYPVLKLRNLAKSDPSKQWYIMASVLLYDCCTHSSSGAVDQDICKRLDKDKQEMILKFCEQLPDDGVTVENVECCIREACRSVFEGLTQNRHFSEHSRHSKPNLDYLSKYSSDEISSFTSESTKSNLFKPTTMLYSESLDYSKDLHTTNKCQGLLLSKKLRDPKKIPFSQTGYSVSCQSSKAVNLSTPKPLTGLVSNPPKDFLTSEVSQKSRDIEPTHEKTPMKFSGTPKAPKKKYKIIEPSFQRPKSPLPPDATNVTTIKTSVKRPSGEDVIQYESFEKHKQSKIIVPSNLNIEKIHRRSGSPEQFSKPIIIERSQVELSAQNYVKTKIIHVSHQNTRTEKESSVQVEKQSNIRDISYQSILRKPKYPVESSKVHSKPGFLESPALSSVSLDSLTRLAPSVGTDPSPSAKTSLEAANAAQILIDSFSSRREDECLKEKRLAKRVRMTEPEEVTKKFASECCGCFTSTASVDAKKMKKRHVFRFASFVGHKSCNFSQITKKPKEAAEDTDSARENSNIKESVPPLDQFEPTSTLASRSPRPPRPPRPSMIHNQVLCISCMLGLLMVGFALLLMFRPNLMQSYRRNMRDLPEPVDRLARIEDDWDVTDSIPIPVSSTHFAWACKNNVCVKLTKVDVKNRDDIFISLSRCTLLCMGNQIWPLPIGEMEFSHDLIAVTTEKLEYKFKTAPSDVVEKYVSKAFKLFLLDLAKLERRDQRKRGPTDLPLTKLVVFLSVFTDQDPALRLDTDETYTLKVDTKNNTVTNVDIYAESFCGLRNGLETLSQLMILDEKTGYLITYSASSIKDGPSYRYRGLMLDTARNYFPVADIIRTVDAMAMCKLNTLHWRISDATSFPLFLESMPRMMYYGAYDSEMTYQRKDVEEIVDRAKVRGIRVVIEVSAPGPVGRAWSSTGLNKCPRKFSNSTCDTLCLRLEMETASFDILERIYRDIISMTNVRDVFHLSNGLFSLANCPNLLEDRDGFLEKALYRLKLANRGFIPKLPIVWLTPQLLNKYEAESWARYGVQLYDLSDMQSESALAKFRLVHSAKWDLSCSMKKLRCHKFKTWQAMHKWNGWRTLNVFALEGGEAMLWSDLVTPSGLDDQIWPRAAAVAERLWSDIVLDSHVAPKVYFRLDTHRWRMLLRGINAHPVWPLWCSFNPESCMAQIKHRNA